VLTLQRFVNSATSAVITRACVAADNCASGKSAPMERICDSSEPILRNSEGGGVCLALWFGSCLFKALGGAEPLH